MASKQEEVLFPEIKAARYGENDRHRRLFIPKYLQKYADDFKLRDAAQERSYEKI